AARGDAADDGDGREHDAVEADFRRLPAEHAGGKGASEKEQAVDAVLVDHAGNKEAHQRPALGELAQRILEFRKAFEDRGAQRYRAGDVRGEQEHRQDEDEVPERRKRSGDARILAFRRIEAEQRVDADQRLSGLRAAGKQEQNGKEGYQAAEIAEPPGDVGDLADLLLANQPGHHRIVQDDREFGGERGEDHQRADGDDRTARRGYPEPGERQNLDRG